MVIYGVDQNLYPGAAAMAGLREGGFSVTGLYLGPAPYHSDAGWMGARAPLAAAGWGFLPVYVGLQSGNVSLGAARGQSDGVNAVQLMTRAGFPAGSVVFLDIETGGPIPPPFEAYVNAWVAAVKGAGWGPGIYCSHLLLSWAQAKTPSIWTFHLPAGTEGQTYTPGQLPAGAIDPGAVATQYRQNVQLTGYGPGVDLSLCSVPDPSAPPA